MTYNLISLLLIAMTSVATVIVFLGYMKARAVSNKLLALASKDFHDKVASILETSNELPDEMLSYLEFLIELANKPDGHLIVLRSLKRRTKMSNEDISRSRNRGKNLTEAIRTLRPELADLLQHTTVLWMNWLVNRNLLIGLLIGLELRKLSVSQGSAEAEPSRAAAAVFQRRRGNDCMA